LEGFTIICNKCGNKAIVTTQKPKEHHCLFMSSDNETLKFNGDSREHRLECTKCDNEIIQEQ